jgi:hypothetical protein
MCAIVSFGSGSISCQFSSGANESIGFGSGDHAPRFHVLLTGYIHGKRQLAKAYLFQEIMLRLGMISRPSLVADSSLEYSVAHTS